MAQTMSVSTQQLSSSDAKVIDCIFDPEAAAAGAGDSTNNLIDDSQPTDQHIHNLNLLRHLQRTERAAIAELEQALSTSPTSPATSTSPALALAFALHRALRTFDDLITTYPTYASAYSNRAQCLRLQETLRAAPPPLDQGCPAAPPAAAILADLSAAIRLASPPASNPQAPVSRAVARTLASAYTQRATVYLGASKAAREAGFADGCGQRGAAAAAARRYEELAAADFRDGGRYGNELARGMVVRLNPYAKVCGGIVREAMKVEMRI